MAEIFEGLSTIHALLEFFESYEGSALNSLNVEILVKRSAKHVSGKQKCYSKRYSRL